MPDGLGRSVYLASFERQRPELERNAGTGAQVFLSLHMGEEFAPDYCRRAEGMCRWLQEAGFRTIADVWVKTVEQFGQPDLVRLARRLGLWALRVDYGLSWDEIAALACELPVVLNASTTPPEQAARIARSSPLAMALHNFYPRPETGADDGFFRERTRAIQQAGLKVLAFVPGDGELRGPVCEGLPTLERHRGLPPSACFADLLIRFGADGAFVGDPGISPREESRIERFCRDGVLELPARLDEAYAGLYDRVFTCRPDSPARLIRFAESREYSCDGDRVAPHRCIRRIRGSITVDNEGYGRYSGEVQLVREDLPADSRVNVVGQVWDSHLLLADCVANGGRFALTRD